MHINPKSTKLEFNLSPMRIFASFYKNKGFIRFNWLLCFRLLSSEFVWVWHTITCLCSSWKFDHQTLSRDFRFPSQNPNSSPKSNSSPKTYKGKVVVDETKLQPKLWNSSPKCTKHLWIKHVKQRQQCLQQLEC